MKLASRPYKGKDKRRKTDYKCAKCKKWMPAGQVEVDHIEPCGSLKSWDDLVSFVQKLFVGVDGYRVLCKPCHVKITQEGKDK